MTSSQRRDVAGVDVTCIVTIYRLRSRVFDRACAGICDSGVMRPTNEKTFYPLRAQTLSGFHDYTVSKFNGLRVICMSLFRHWIYGFGMFLLSSGGEATDVTLAYGDQPFAPYQMGQGISPADPPGLAVELILQTAAELDIQVQLRRMPVKRLLHLLEYNLLDGAIGYSYTPGRAAFLRYPKTAAGAPDRDKRLYSLNYYLFSRPDFVPDGLNGQLSTLNQYRVGVVTGSSVAQLLDEQGVRYDPGRTQEQNLGKLLSGRLDLILGPDEPTRQVIKRLGWEKQIRRFGEPMLARDYYLVFSKPFCRQNGTLCELWWQTLQQRRNALPKGKYAD